jgi:hypothetical protein
MHICDRCGSRLANYVLAKIERGEISEAHERLRPNVSYAVVGQV